MKRLILIAILSSSIASVSCNTDRGTILNMPFFSVFGNKSAAITSFAINGVKGTINGTDITLTLPCVGTLNDLAASFTITGDRVEVNGVEQENGVSRNDFTVPVVYTVYTKNGSSKDYTVRVTIAHYSAKDITLFSINGIHATISGTNISLVLPYGTDPSSLVATYNTTGRLVRTGGAIQISGVTPNNFSSPRTYTVEACDGSTQNFTVTVTIAPSNARDITGFTIMGISGNIGADTITLTVPFGTDLEHLTPTITHTGVSVTPASGVSNDFSEPNVEYTVIAANGMTKTYRVTVSEALNHAKDIQSFTILGIPGTIGANAITLTVPFGSDLEHLTPTITHTGASVSPRSGETVDFTDSVIYTVTAANGTTKEYEVTVTEAPSNVKDITHFEILSIEGTIVEGGGIDDNTITVNIPYWTDRSNLTPTITHTGASIDPATGLPNDFTNPDIEYTVTAADGTTKVYLVTVNVAPSPSKDITRFTIHGRNGTITESGDLLNNTIAITVPSWANRSSLTPGVTHTGASVSPASGVSQNFTNPVPYTVTAPDATTKRYTVTVTQSTDVLMPGTYAAGYYHNGTNTVACLWDLTDPLRTRIDLESASSKAVSVSVDTSSGNTVYVAGTYGSNACYWKINGAITTREDLLSSGGILVEDSLISGGYLYISGTCNVTGTKEACYWKINLSTGGVGDLISLSDGSGANAYEMTKSADGTIYIAGTANHPPYSSASPCFWLIDKDTGTDVQHFVFNNGSSGKTVMLDGSHVIIGGWFEYNSPYTQAKSWTYSGSPVPGDNLLPELSSPNASIVSSSLNSSTVVRYIVGQLNNKACYWVNETYANTMNDGDPSFAYGIGEINSQLYITGYYTGTSGPVASVWVINGATTLSLPTGTTAEAAARDVFIKN